MTFAHPFFLVLLLLTPMFLDRQWLARLFPWTKQEASASAIQFSTAVPLHRLPISTRMKIRMYLLSILRILSFSFLVIALARPQTITSFAESETSGRDIMLSLDISGSMQALDFFIEDRQVNRLTALKHVVKQFVSDRKGDRIGLVIFGTDVFTQCPLTNDQNILLNLVDSLDFGMVGDGTALGDGLALAVKRLGEIEDNSKVIVLVTDGVKTAGSIDPIEAAKIAKEKGIKVYTIGIGGSKPAPMPIRDIFGNIRLQYMPVELDEKTLRTIAEITDGKYFHAEETKALQEIYEEISKLEERTIETFEYSHTKEEFLQFVLFGLLLLCLTELLSQTRYRVLPE